MTRPPVGVEVIGEAVPQGSMRSFERNGRRMTVANNAGRLERWRGDVRDAAQRVIDGPYGGPVILSISCRYARPKSHLLVSGEPRKGAPILPRPDVDKLARSILDALTGIAYADDSQVQVVAIGKTYGDRSVTQIIIEYPKEGV